ncbi:MAG: glycine-rich protein [Actinomycetota bacterium]|nr:hypothetical protein [Actinomycetota bacterium]
MYGLAALLIVGWVGAYALKLKPSGAGLLATWGSLGFVLLLTAGAISWATFVYNPGNPASVQFNYTGGVQTWTVPAGVKSATFTVIGAQGGVGCANTANGNPNDPGGNGGETIVTMAVTPGQVLQIYVGGKGHDAICGPNDPPAHAPGGFNGGAVGGAGALIGKGSAYDGGGGGGASDVRHAPYGLVTRDIVAGGGGGGGGWEGEGGGGGGLQGQTGPGANGQGGGGGTQVAGGAGGPNGGGGLAGDGGTFGLGGAGADHGNGQTAGGGGGGGWNGGGGGGSKIYDYGGGGGGGSGHGPANVTLISGAWSGGNGSVTITYTMP